MSDRTAHPAADLFPLMGADELASLAQDIKANGLRHPVILDADGRVLDGRNRLAACEAAGVEPQFVTVEAEVDPIALAVSLNVKRRNLSKGQTAIAAADAWDMVAGQEGKRAKKVGPAFQGEPHLCFSGPRSGRA